MSGALILQWAIALGVGAIVNEIIRSLFQRKKMDADAAESITNAAKTITDSATSLLSPLHAEIASLREEVGRLTAELAATRDELSHLRDRVRDTDEGLEHDQP